MKTALPMNSIRFISGEACGMYLLRMRPDIKAPKMPSKPMSDVNAADRNITDST